MESDNISGSTTEMLLTVLTIVSKPRTVPQSYIGEKFLVKIAMPSVKTMKHQIKDGSANSMNNLTVLAKLASTMLEFKPRFETITGTKARTEDERAHRCRFRITDRCRRGRVIAQY